MRSGSDAVTLRVPTRPMGRVRNELQRMAGLMGDWEGDTNGGGGWVVVFSLEISLWISVVQGDWVATCKRVFCLYVQHWSCI